VKILGERSGSPKRTATLRRRRSAAPVCTTLTIHSRPRRTKAFAAQIPLFSPTASGREMECSPLETIPDSSTSRRMPIGLDRLVTLLRDTFSVRQNRFGSVRRPAGLGGPGSEAPGSGGNQQPTGVLQIGDHVIQEPCRGRSVDQAMVVRQAQRHHQANRDLIVDDDRQLS